MIDDVVLMLRETAVDLVLPRFGRLAAADVAEKNPGDLVTVVDTDVEAILRRRLTGLLAGSVTVGEEEAAADPGLLDRLSGERPVWLIDPIDGTGNFAAGRQPFAMMVTLVHSGRIRLSVMYEPVPGTVAAAEAGSGAYLDGVRAVMETTPVTDSAQLRGALAVTYLPDRLKQQVLARAELLGEAMPPQFCAGREYPNLARGVQHFTLFWRSIAWDHAPGTLFVREAGGVVRHFDGTDYDPVRPKPGLLACRDEHVFDLARQALNLQ